MSNEDKKYKQGDAAGRCEIKIYHDLSSLRAKVLYHKSEFVLLLMEEIWLTTWDV